MKFIFGTLSAAIALVFAQAGIASAEETKWYPVSEDAYEVIIKESAKGDAAKDFNFLTFYVRYSNYPELKYSLFIDYYTEEITETLYSRHSSNLPYRGEVENIRVFGGLIGDDVESGWNTRSNNIDFESFGIDQFDLTNVDQFGNYTNRTIQITGLTDKNSSLPLYSITSHSNQSVIPGDGQTYSINLSGDILENEMEKNENVRTKRILLDESGEYLDSDPWIYWSVEETDINNGANWSIPFGIETGFNKYVIQAYTASNTTDQPPLFGDVSEIMIQRLADPPKPANDIATLTEFTDIWFAEPDGNSVNDYNNAVPFRADFLGIMHGTNDDRLVYAMDIDGFGIDDFVYINDVAELWISRNFGNGGLEIPYKATNLYIHDNENNWTVLPGEFNKRNGEELIQINSDGTLTRTEAAVYENELDENYYDFRNGWVFESQPSSFRHDPANGKHLFIADMTRDYRDDLIQFTNDGFGTIQLMEFQESKFDVPINLGVTGFRHDPENDFQVLFADVTGDDMADAIQIAYGEVWVAVTENNGKSLRTPERWGAPGFRGVSAPNDNWWTYISNGGPDEGANLFQINEFGELWVCDLDYNSSTNTGTAGPPQFVVALGFKHQKFGKWQTYFGNFLRD